MGENYNISYLDLILFYVVGLFLTVIYFGCIYSPPKIKHNFNTKHNLNKSLIDF